MLNKNLDIEKIKNEYKEKRRILIPDFLDTDVAEFIYKGFLNLTEKNLWYQSNFGNHRYFDKNMKGWESGSIHFTYKFEKYPVTNFKLSYLLDADCRRKNVNNLRDPDKEHPERELSESHPLRKMGAMINSKQFHNLITLITGYKLTYDSSYCFASRYTADDFMGAHSDGGLPRKVGYILNMTKHWLVHWGGDLVILDNTYKNVIEDYTPSFNNLILFDVPLPHAVLPVSIYCQSDRYALTGWFFDYSQHRRC
jgi:Rps23 Pro-64 3,4-dihydroxylase Tpa1-like proline 4-hydroxylase